MKLVINKCYGGFGLSDLAYERMVELGIPIRQYNDDDEACNAGEVIFDIRLSPVDPIFKTRKEYEVFYGRYWETFISQNRSHPILIKVVEELGEKAWGQHAELCIVEIPDNVKYEIYNYDGVESVHEKHRIW